MKYNPYLLLLCVLAGLFLIHSCRSKGHKEVNITHIPLNSRVHKPQNGMNVIDFWEAEAYYASPTMIKREGDIYFEHVEITDHIDAKQFIDLIEKEGKYLELPSDWYAHFYENRRWLSRNMYRDIDDKLLSLYFPSHLVNVSYRVVINGTDSVFIGKDYDPCTIDVLLHNTSYYYTKAGFYEKFDSLYTKFKKSHGLYERKGFYDGEEWE